MSQIFISYRREDSAGYAGRLGEALERRLGQGAVFRDVVALQPGQDFVDTIATRLRTARACLVLIGREWLDVKGRSGRRRLEEENDYVVHEVATALAGPDMLVIPVLVEGARMPVAEELPEPIKGLARRHATSLRDESWDGDVDRLVGVVRKATGSTSTSEAVRYFVRSHRVSLAGLALTAFLAFFLIQYLTTQSQNPPGPSEVDRTADGSAEPGGASSTASTALPAPVTKAPEVAEPAGDVQGALAAAKPAPAPSVTTPVRPRAPATAASNVRRAPTPDSPIASAPATPRRSAENPTGLPGRESGDAERPAVSPAAAPVGPAAGSAAAAVLSTATPAAAPPAATPAALVRQVIAEYEQAAEALDAQEVRRLWPTAPDALGNSYRNLVSQSVDLECADPAVSGDTATVSCRERIRSVGAGRITLPLTTSTATFSLRRNGAMWEISRISRQPVR